MKCLLDVTNSDSDFNEMVTQDASNLLYQDKYTRYSNPYFVSFTDLFSIRLDIKEVPSQIKIINNGVSSIIVSKDEETLSEIQNVIFKSFNFKKANLK